MPAITGYVMETKSNTNFGQMTGRMEREINGELRFEFPAAGFGTFSLQYEHAFTINDTGPDNKLYTGLVWQGQATNSQAVAVQKFLKR